VGSKGNLASLELALRGLKDWGGVALRGDDSIEGAYRLTKSNPSTYETTFRGKFDKEAVALWLNDGRESADEWLEGDTSRYPTALGSKLDNGRNMLRLKYTVEGTDDFGEGNLASNLAALEGETLEGTPEEEEAWLDNHLAVDTGRLDFTLACVAPGAGDQLDQDWVDGRSDCKVREV